MSTPVIAPETPIDQGSPPRRAMRSRFAPGHVVLVVVALLAGLVNYAVLAGGQPQAEVLVAANDLPAGHVLTDEDLHAVTVVLDGPVRQSFVPVTRSMSGRVLVVDLPAGAPLRASDVRTAAGRDGLRRMSLPVTRDLAVGGAIDRGDRVDVLLADDGQARWLVSGAEVLAVAASGSSPLEGLGGYFITIAVETPHARCLAAALTTGQLTVVLSTGAEEVVADGCTDDGVLVPLTSDAATAGADPRGSRRATETTDPGAEEPAA